MRRRPFLLGAFVMFALAACGTEAAGPEGVVGTWTVDADRARADFVKHLDSLIDVASEADKSDIEQRKAQFLGEAPLQIKLSFQADNTYAATTTDGGQQSTARGTWKKSQSTWRLTQTHENDKELPKAKTITFRMEEGELVGGRVPELPLHFKRD